MIRVTHCIGLIDRPGHPPLSGAENHLMILLPALAEAGVDVELIALLWDEGPSAQAALSRLREAGVRITLVRRPWPWLSGRLPRLLAWGIRALAAWAMLLRVLTRRRDRLLHLHLELAVFPVLARLAGCRPPVLSFHNDERRYARPLWRWWMRRLGDWCAGNIAITEHVRTWLVANGMPPGRVRTVYYGVPRPLRCPHNRADLGLPVDRPVVGFVGRLTEQKNLPLLLHTAALMRDEAVFAIVGTGDESTALRQLAVEIGADNVRFCGHIPGAAGLMPLFDVFCLPSRWEGLGLVLVEAMLQDVPVVGSANGAIPEVLGHGTHGIVVTGDDPKAFASALRAVLSGGTAVRLRTEGAQRYASLTFTVEAMASRTMDLYRQAAS